MRCDLRNVVPRASRGVALLAQPQAQQAAASPAPWRLQPRPLEAPAPPLGGSSAVLPGGFEYLALLLAIVSSYRG